MRRPGPSEPAVAHDTSRWAYAAIRGLVGHEDHGRARGSAACGQELHHLLAREAVERAGGLVGEHDGGFE